MVLGYAIAFCATPMARRTRVVSGDEHAEGRCGQWGSVGFLVNDEGFEMMKHDRVMMEMLAQYWRYLLTPKFQSMSNLCTRVLSMHSTHSPTSKQQCMIQIFSAHKCRFRSIYFYIYTITHINACYLFSGRSFAGLPQVIFRVPFWKFHHLRNLRVKCHILLLVPKSNSSGYSALTHPDPGHLVRSKLNPHCLKVDPHSCSWCVCGIPSFVHQIKRKCLLQVQTDALADLHLKVGMMWLGLLLDEITQSYRLFKGIQWIIVGNGIVDELLMAY